MWNSYQSLQHNIPEEWRSSLYSEVLTWYFPLTLLSFSRSNLSMCNFYVSNLLTSIHSLTSETGIYWLVSHSAPLKDQKSSSCLWECNCKGRIFVPHIENFKDIHEHFLIRTLYVGLSDPWKWQKFLLKCFCLDQFHINACSQVSL
jgi:hypothetical protein